MDLDDGNERKNPMSPAMTLRNKIEQFRKADPRIVFNQDAEKFVLQGKLSSPIDPAKVKKTPHLVARTFLTDHKELLGSEAVTFSVLQ
ncbi:MAG TPA: hypothetical protein VLC51_09365 [Nitrospira sp.]|nr:hypothetical protein [Nitrospira sp.]